MSAENENNRSTYDVAIAGGGLAGLVTAILLVKQGFRIILFEKKSYPFHKVCGEYVSNEVLTLLCSLGLDPFEHGASSITRLRISDPSGKNIHAALDLGGFGLSRYVLDKQLAEIAKSHGVDVRENCRVHDIAFQDNSFRILTGTGIYCATLALGAYGKRTLLDKKLKRKFIEKHTGFLGVKYHVKVDYPIDEIGLDNFPGGYCGIVKIEDDLYNLCYLYNRKRRNAYNSIAEIEKKVLFTNPIIRDLFGRAKFSGEEPEVINEIPFQSKPAVEDHLLLCGDAAGLITPLCGNGMAMAIHGGKILSDHVTAHLNPGTEISSESRSNLENEYARRWRSEFSSRLFWGRRLQEITGNSLVTSAGLRIIHAIPQLEKWLIRKTHGEVIK